MPDHYRLLGITPDATDAQVRRAIRRYWQHVARHRPAREQQAFLVAATVSNPHLRHVYDPAYRPGPDPAHRAATYLRQLSWRLRTDLQQAESQSRRLENQVRGLRGELEHVLDYQQEVTEMRLRRRQLWGRLLLLLLVPVAYGTFRLLLGGHSGLSTLAGPPYQPVAEGNIWLLARHDSAQVYEQAELMPQFPGGAKRLRVLLRQQVYNATSLATAERLCASGQLRFVVDSAGWAGPAQVLGVAATDTGSYQTLRGATQQLPRMVPGYQRGRPVAVRLTVALVQ